jgi:hypothetical protein
LVASRSRAGHRRGGCRRGGTRARRAWALVRLDRDLWSNPSPSFGWNVVRSGEESHSGSRWRRWRACIAGAAIRRAKRTPERPGVTSRSNPHTPGGIGTPQWSISCTRLTNRDKIRSRPYAARNRRAWFQQRRPSPRAVGGIRLGSHDQRSALCVEPGTERKRYSVPGARMEGAFVRNAFAAIHSAKTIGA